MALADKQEHRFPSAGSCFENNYIFTDTEEAREIEREFSMQFIETPGHTDCSISLLYHNVLFCGDAAMNGLPSWNRITIWVEDLDDFQLSWEKIIQLQPQTIYPGHGRPFNYHELSRYIEKINKRKLIPLS